MSKKWKFCLWRCFHCWTKLSHNLIHSFGRHRGSGEFQSWYLQQEMLLFKTSMSVPRLWYNRLLLRFKFGILWSIHRHQVNSESASLWFPWQNINTWLQQGLLCMMGPVFQSECIGCTVRWRKGLCAVWVKSCAAECFKYAALGGSVVWCGGPDGCGDLLPASAAEATRQ